jgi:hypothetical protein
MSPTTRKPAAGATRRRAAAPVALPFERSAGFDQLTRDLLTFVGSFERFSAKRVATGGIGKKTLQRVAPFLRRPDDDYVAFLGLFLVDRRILFEGDEHWEVSRPNLARTWPPERLLRSLYHFWLRTPLWNESLQDPDVLSYVRREYVSQDPTLEGRRRRVCEELASTPPDATLELGDLLSRLDRSFQGRRRPAETSEPEPVPGSAAPVVSGEEAGFAPYGGRVGVGAAIQRMLTGPLTWLGVVEPIARRSAAGDRFRVTAFGRLVLAENWEAIADGLGPSFSDPEARVTIQPNLEILAPPDLEPATYLNLARLADLRSVDIVTSMAITWDSVMNALDRGWSADELLAVLAGASATGVPTTVEQLVADCAGRHGEVRIGIAGPYVEARERLLLRELEANPRFAPYIQRRIGDHLALLTSDVDLTRLHKELRKAGYSVHAGTAEKVQVTPHGAQVSLTRRELEELYAAVRATTKLARELDPDVDLTLLAALEETFVLQLSRHEDTLAQERAKELEALVEKVLRAHGGRPKPPARAEVRDTEEIRELLVAAVETKEPVEIEYDGFQGVTRRVVEPESFDGRYLTAFCRLRQDQRVFNTARILSARVVADS